MDSEERFDVVDRADRVIGRFLRTEVHARGLLHRAVHVLVFNGRGELLLQKRSPHKDLFPGRWGTSCAGHLDSGESYDEAARREFAEELGKPAPKLRRCFKIEACAATGHEFVWVYETRDDGPFRPDQGEVDELRWIEPETFEEWSERDADAFTPSFLFVWERYRKFTFDVRAT